MSKFYQPHFSLTVPSGKCVAVTPSDSDDLPFFTRGIYVGGDGDVAVLTESDDTVTFKAVPAGTVLPIRVRRVLEATDATNLVALF